MLVNLYQTLRRSIQNTVFVMGNTIRKENLESDKNTLIVLNLAAVQRKIYFAETSYNSMRRSTIYSLEAEVAERMTFQWMQK